MTEFKCTMFDKYLLLDRLAVGGMAEVFRAKQMGEKGFEKLIVLKRMLPHLTDEKEMVQHFIDEARLAAHLKHDNIVHVYDFGTVDGAFFIAMEYLFGKDLQAVVKKAGDTNNPLSLENILLLLSKACEGLAYAHNLKNFDGTPLNIIHRDISPQNIFITFDGFVKIIDFGIARAASKSTKTQAGIIKGKVAYMSPEQAAGGEIDHRSDIFALGILFYELLAGRPMFQGDTFQVLAQVRNAQYEPLNLVNPDLPDEIYRIADRALAKNPDDRYPSCDEMLEDLENCIFQLGLRPSLKKISSYMQTLFQDEYGREKESIARAIRVNVPDAESLASSSPRPLHYQETAIFTANGQETLMLPSSRPGWIARAGQTILSATKSKRRMAVFVAAALVLLTGALAILFYPETKTAVSESQPREGVTVKSESGKQPVPQPADAENDAADKRAAQKPVVEEETSEKSTARQFFNAVKGGPNQQTIRQLLDAADAALAANRLTTPADDSAYFFYNEVLKIDPKNASARQGMVKIADAYAGLAEGELNKLNRTKARTFIDNGLRIDPSHKRLLELKNESATGGKVLIHGLRNIFGGKK